MQTLCLNCYNQPSCLWKNGRVILCNEHWVASALDAKKQSTKPIQEQIQVHSLCDSCLHNTSCAFKSNELKTIFCEEHQ